MPTHPNDQVLSLVNRMMALEWRLGYQARHGSQVFPEASNDERERLFEALIDVLSSRGTNPPLGGGR